VLPVLKRVPVKEVVRIAKDVAKGGHDEIAILEWTEYVRIRWRSTWYFGSDY
jgi:hypothetical protein